MGNIFSSYPYIFVNLTTSNATQVNANFAAIASAVNANAAKNGANSDITSMNALQSLTVGGPTTVSGDISMTGTGELLVASGTSAQRSPSPTAGMFRFNTTTSWFEGYAGVGSGWVDLGRYAAPYVTGLYATNGVSPDTTFNVSFDAAVITQDTGGAVRRTNGSMTINAATVGANGLDAGVLAASVWYYIWLIDNGTTVAALLSLSNTAPTMPSGYTYKVRVGAIQTDATAKFLRLALRGNKAAYAPAVGSNTTEYPYVDFTSPSSSFVPVSLSPTCAPPTASCVDVTVESIGIGTARVASTFAGITLADNSQNPQVASITLVDSGKNVYARSSSGDGYISVVGWTDTVSVV